ncbi:MAG: hypothetical protein L6R38_007428 [Xanthoria sp. 2 TBL-2021]|nr:MAG: hypothetical protein L6R38_007428 [Xanthoria sp. 2 TBL-2021]
MATNRSTVVWGKCLPISSVRPKSFYYSQEVEMPENLDIIAEFENLDFAKAFQTSLRAGLIYRSLWPKLLGAVTCYVIDMRPVDPPTAPTKAPVMEIATFWLPVAPTPAAIDEFDSALRTLGTAVAAAQGAVFVKTGHVQGKVANPTGQFVTAVVALVGWQNIDAHIAFTRSPAFATSIAGIGPFLSGTTDHHVNLARIPLASMQKKPNPVLEDS